MTNDVIVGKLPFKINVHHNFFLSSKEVQDAFASFSEGYNL